MSKPHCTVAFHIGAHKTATSHLQRSIEAQVTALTGKGLAYLGPDHLRMPRQSVTELFGLKPNSKGMSDQITALRQSSRRLVISEENYIGTLLRPRGKPFTQRYPDAATRIDAVAHALGHKIEVFLAIRRPTAFLNAAYCQQLMAGHVVRMAKFRQNNPVAAVDWRDLALRLRGVSGIGELVIWCYEDYAAHFSTICTRLLGHEGGPLVSPLNARIHPSLSSAAVAEVLHRHVLRENGDLGLEARRLLPVDHGYPAFDGFTAADHVAGDTAYRDQIAAIAAMPDVTLLDPLWASSTMRA